MATVKPSADTIKVWYDDKKWDSKMVHAAVVAGAITTDEADAIINGTVKKTTKKKTTTDK